MDGTENFTRPLYEILENDYNIIVKTSREEIRAAGADPFIAGKLEIEVGDPILIRKRFVSDINDLPIEYKPIHSVIRLKASGNPNLFHKIFKSDFIH